MTTDQPYITELRKLYELQPGLTREEFNNAKLVFARQSQEEQQVLLTGDNNEKLDYVRWLLERLQQPAIPPPPAPAVSEDYVVVNRNGELLASLPPARYTEVEEIINALVAQRHIHKDTQNNRRLTIDMPTPMSFYLAQYLKYGVEAVLGYHERHLLDAWRILAVSCKLGNLLDALNERLGRPSSRPSTTTRKTAQRLAWVIRVVVLFLFGGCCGGA
mmetsp:Transcript_2184/g.4904  ORF Transcript_2184/g.4904 Transcript_2184/m.4904 type:complete len:217 (+) Transcript_2184:283-933(+)